MVDQHVLASRLSALEGYRAKLESFKRYGREEFLDDEDIAERLKGWMGFRNVLVHMYLETDHQRSYEAIQKELGDLQVFAERMARFLEA